jgi:phage host-nuclease inhibitor protein Gam
MSNDFKVTFSPEVQNLFEECNQQNEQVRQWCQANGFYDEGFEIDGQRIASSFYERGAVTVQAAAVTPFEHIICEIKVTGVHEWWQKVYSFEEFLQLMEEFQSYF